MQYKYSNTSSVTLRATPSPAGEGWQKFLLPSAQVSDPRPPCTFSGRADNACTNLLGFFVRYVRTRGIVEAAESRKTIGFRFTLCRTHSPRTARATNSCTPPVVWKEDGASPPCWLLVLLVTQKYDKHKEFLSLFLQKTPHPSRFARHLLPLEKAGKNPCFRQRRSQIHARATHYPAGVQTMRARICSAFSCDMFARVVV